MLAHLPYNVSGPSVSSLHNHFYDAMLVSCEKLFDNEIELQAFEDQLRSMFGTKVRCFVAFLA